MGLLNLTCQHYLSRGTKGGAAFTFFFPFVLFFYIAVNSIMYCSLCCIMSPFFLLMEMSSQRNTLVCKVYFLINVIFCTFTKNVVLAADFHISIRLFDFQPNYKV